MGPQRLVGIFASRTAARCPRHGHRTGGVATELTDHITHPDAKQAAEQTYKQLAFTAGDIAQVIAFAVTRPHRMTLNEILIRPTAQALTRSRLTSR